jgi:hypothetical protein
VSKRVYALATFPADHVRQSRLRIFHASIENETYKEVYHYKINLGLMISFRLDKEALIFMSIKSMNKTFIRRKVDVTFPMHKEELLGRDQLDSYLLEK